MTAERRMLMPESWSLRDLVLATAEEAIEGYIACFDLATGFVVVGKTALGLLPIGTFKQHLIGDGVQKVQVQLFEEIHANWFNNDTGTPVATTDIGKPCYLKDGQTVSMDGTGCSTAGRVLAVSASGGQVLIHAGIAMSGPSDVDTDAAAIAAAAASAAAAQSTANSAGTVAAAAQSTANAAQLVTTSLTTTGTAPAFVLTPSPALGAYAAGNRYTVAFHATSKRLATLNVSGLGSKKLKRYDNLGAKVGFYAIAGIRTDIVYDGTDWVVIDQRPDYALRLLQMSSSRSWTAQVSPVGNGWSSVCWSPELMLFVAVAFASGSANEVMTSPDGVTWISRVSAADSTWTSVCWSPELLLFVAVAAGSNIATSPDGITWTLRTGANANTWIKVVWAAELGLFVATSVSGTGNRVQTSPDGINWTARVSAADNNWDGLVWAAEISLLVATSITGTGNRVMTSPDGINWTSRVSAADNDWRSVAWSPELGLFVAVAGNSTATATPMYSSDGITWTLGSAAPLAIDKMRDILWVSELGLFIAVSEGASGLVWISSDGLHWQSRAGTTIATWQQTAWAPELGILVSVGLAGAIMTSGAGSSGPADFQRAYGAPLIPIAAGLTLVDATIYWFYMGYTTLRTPVNFVRFAVTVGGTGAQVAEVAVARTPKPPNRAAQSLFVLGVSGALDALTGIGVLGNSSSLGVVVLPGDHWWVGLRTHMATTQPTLEAVGGDLSQGRVLATAGAAALTAGATFTGALIAHALTAQAPALLASTD